MHRKALSCFCVLFFALALLTSCDSVFTGSLRGNVIDENGVGLAHNRLAVMDPENGHQPMTVSFRGNIYTIVYNGELYNTPQLRRDLEREGVTLATHCDTEVLLYSYACWGRGCLERLNGI